MIRSHDDEYDDDDDDYNEDYIICENNSQINFYFNILEFLVDFLCVFKFWVFRFCFFKSDHFFLKMTRRKTNQRSYLDTVEYFIFGNIRKCILTASTRIEEYIHISC